MANEKDVIKRIQLLIDDAVYADVQREAGASRCSANAWIRDAVAMRLNGIEHYESEAELYRLWEAMEPKGRELLLQHARLILAVPAMRREGFKVPEELLP